jgi:hypothetical protein
MGSPPTTFGHFRASKRLRPQCLPSVRPMRAQGQPSRTSTAASPGTSGPCGHRGNSRQKHQRRSANVRPMRAQGQLPAPQNVVSVPSRPAHAGTGATLLRIRLQRRSASGPCGHRGNIGRRQPRHHPTRPAHAGTGATDNRGSRLQYRCVRPMRAQGQLDEETEDDLTLGPAHAGTGATNVSRWPHARCGVRPMRAQGQPASTTKYAGNVRSPAHAGTGATHGVVLRMAPITSGPCGHRAAITDASRCRQ